MKQTIAKLFAAFLLFTACSDEMELPERKGGELAIYGNVGLDSTFVSVYTTYDYVLDDYSDSLAERHIQFANNEISSVVIYENDNLFDTLVFKEGIYDALEGFWGCYFVTYKTPTDGAKYTLEVITKNHGTATASTIMPNKVYIDSYDPIFLEYYVGRETYTTGSKYRINIYVQDPPEKNYYGFEFREYIKCTYKTNEALEIDDDKLCSNQKFAFSYNAYIVDYYNYYELQTDSITGKKFMELPCRLSTYSQEQFLFNKSYSRTQPNENEGFEGEPIFVYNNIKNGKGIFGATNYTSSNIILNIN